MMYYFLFFIPNFQLEYTLDFTKEGMNQGNKNHDYYGGSSGNYYESDHHDYYSGYS